MAELRRGAESSGYSRSRSWWSEELDAIPVQERMVYAGLYQGYAWDQGARGAVAEYRAPDEFFWLGQSEEGDDRLGFNLVRFMACAADMDSDGSVHRWQAEVRNGDLWIRIGCTEDDSLVGLREKGKSWWYWSGDQNALDEWHRVQREYQKTWLEERRWNEI